MFSERSEVQRMTKKEMRKAACISTSFIAQMDKNEPIAMESLGKICVTLDCTLDNIVEIQNNAEKGG